MEDVREKSREKNLEAPSPKKASAAAASAEEHKHDDASKSKRSSTSLGGSLLQKATNLKIGDPDHNLEL